MPVKEERGKERKKVASLKLVRHKNRRKEEKKKVSWRSCDRTDGRNIDVNGNIKVPIL